MNWVLALSECCYLAGELQAVRDAGFTEEALRHPKDELGFLMLCAWNNCPPERAPRGWRYWPNEPTKRAWERVAKAVIEYGPERQTS